MARTTYAPKQTYTGNGTLADYTFDFKIEVNTQLLVVEYNTLNVEVERVRGDDVTYLNSVLYNPDTGGGSIQLAANLTSGHKLVLLLANDAPTQPFEFSNKLSFNLKRFEKALDFLGGEVQRLAYRGAQALRISDFEDQDTFDASLPADISANIGNSIIVNVTGDGFEFGNPGDPELQSDINVNGVSQGRYNSGDVISAGTALEEVIRNMLILDTPPVFTLSGSGAKLIESGTLINPTLTGAFTANDAGPANNYELRENGITVHTNPVPDAFAITAFNIVDTSFTYEATVDHDANLLPLGSIISNTIVYTGARAAFSKLQGDIVNIRTNDLSNVGVASGSNIAVTGDATTGKKMMMWSYPDSLGAPTALNYYNGFSNNPVIGDLVREADQMVDDANAGNPVLYRVYTYTQLIDFTTSDVLTLTI